MLSCNGLPRCPSLTWYTVKATLKVSNSDVGTLTLVNGHPWRGHLLTQLGCEGGGYHVLDAFATMQHVLCQPIACFENWLNLTSPSMLHLLH